MSMRFFVRCAGMGERVPVPASAVEGDLPVEKRYIDVSAFGLGKDLYKERKEDRK